MSRFSLRPPVATQEHAPATRIAVLADVFGKLVATKAPGHIGPLLGMLMKVASPAIADISPADALRYEKLLSDLFAPLGYDGTVDDYADYLRALLTQNGVD